MPVKRVTVCHLFGLAIHADVGFFYLFALVSWSLAEGLFPLYVPALSRAAYWAMALAGAVLLLASLLLHELAHAVVGRRHGVAIHGITLFLFGGLSELDEEPPDAEAELWMACAGPAASLLLAALFHEAALYGDRVGLGALPRAVSAYLASANCLVAVFNLTPAFPLDGGRVLRAVLWKWRDEPFATKWAARLGALFGVLLMAAGVTQLFLGSVVAGMWWALVGLFVRFAARRSTRAVSKGVTASGAASAALPAVAPDVHSATGERHPREKIMPLGATFHPAVVSVPRDASIGAAARAMREHHVGAVVVVEPRADGREIPVGILTDRDIVIELVAEDVPLDKVRVADVMSQDLVTAHRDDAVNDNIAVMMKHGIKRLPLVDESGALVGIFSADDYVESVAKELLGLARLPRRQMQVERRLRA